MSKTPSGKVELTPEPIREDLKRQTVAPSGRNCEASEQCRWSTFCLERREGLGESIRNEPASAPAGPR